MKRSTSFSLALAGAVVLLLVAIGAALAVLPPGGTFNDDNGNVHEGNIEAIAAEGITRGCNPPTSNRYCPSSNLSRGQMAAFIRRALSLPSSSTDYFVDDNDSIFEGDINALAEAGITRGCNPPTSDRFCPDGTTTREQMAAFLRRAFNYPTATIDYFTDDDTSIFEADINSIAKAGVTLGCNPPGNTRYCPKDLVKRDQMASFFARALGLSPIYPPPPTTTTTTTTPPPTTTTTTIAPVYAIDLTRLSYQGNWSGTARGEAVYLARDRDGSLWTGNVGPDSVSLKEEVSGDVWSGLVGSDAIDLVVTPDSGCLITICTTPAKVTGWVGSDAVSLGQNLDDSCWSGSVGSGYFILCLRDSVVRNSDLDIRREVAAITPMLFEIP